MPCSVLQSAQSRILAGLGSLGVVVALVAGCNTGDQTSISPGSLLSSVTTGATITGIDDSTSFLLPNVAAGSGCVPTTYGDPGNTQSAQPQKHKFTVSATRWPVTVKLLSGSVPTGIKFHYTDVNNVVTVASTPSTGFEVLESSTGSGEGFFYLRTESNQTISALPANVYRFKLQLREKESPQVTEKWFSIMVVDCTISPPHVWDPGAPLTTCTTASQSATGGGITVQGISNPPSASAIARGDVVLKFNLVDCSENLTTFLVQWRDVTASSDSNYLGLNVDGFGTQKWSNCTPTSASPPMTKLMPPPGSGQEFTFIWDSVSDFANAVPNGKTTPLGYGLVRAMVEFRVFVAENLSDFSTFGGSNAAIEAHIDSSPGQSSVYPRETITYTQGTTLPASVIQPLPTALGPGWPTNLGGATSGLLINNEPFPYDPGDANLTTGADMLLGQLDDTKKDNAQPKNTFNQPSGVFATDSKLFIADTGNHRVIMFHSLPSAPKLVPAASVPNATPASPGITAFDTLLTESQISFFGQSDAKGNQANAGQQSTNGRGFTNPTDVHLSANFFYVVDQGNNRVLVWKKDNMPSPGQATASKEVDYVLGQPTKEAGIANNSFDGSTVNQGSTGSYGLSGPTGVVEGGGWVYVSDTSNNRITCYKVVDMERFTKSKAEAVRASFVLGQPSNLESMVNYPLGNPTRTNMNGPRRLTSDGNNLMVTDAANHRILVWNKAPTAAGATPDLVMGQGGFTDNEVIFPGGTAPNDISTIYKDSNNNFLGPRYYYQNPFGIGTDGVVVAVADTSNSRIMIYPFVPTTGNQPAAINVIGSVDFTTPPPALAAAQGGPAYKPTRYDFDQAQDCAIVMVSNQWQLWVVDTNNNRVLRITPPATGG